MSNIEHLTHPKSLARGPALHFYIHYARGAVQLVTITPSTTQGMMWTFQSPQLDPALETSLEAWLDAYSRKKEPPLQIPVAWASLPLFTQHALQVIENIPFGVVYTYGQVAARLGSPQAARAVGGACRRNLFPLLIPCHRVLDSKYGYRGYSAGGIAIKQSLLDFEEVDI